MADKIELFTTKRAVYFINISLILTQMFISNIYVLILCISNLILFSMKNMSPDNVFYEKFTNCFSYISNSNRPLRALKKKKPRDKRIQDNWISDFRIFENNCFHGKEVLGAQ